MKAIFLLLAVSLAANVVLGWMLWQRHPASKSEPALVQSAPSEETTLPLPTGSAPLLAPPFLPLPDNAASDSGRPSPPEARAGSPPVPEDKPYGPPLPPNRHAYPPWPQRVPYHKPQFERALLVEPR